MSRRPLRSALFAAALVACSAPPGAQPSPVQNPCEGLDGRACRSQVLALAVPLASLVAARGLDEAGAPPAVPTVALAAGLAVGPAVGLADAGMTTQALRGTAVRSGGIALGVGLPVLLLDPGDYEGWIDLGFLGKAVLLAAPGLVVYTASAVHDERALRQRLLAETRARRSGVAVRVRGAGLAVVASW